MSLTDFVNEIQASNQAEEFEQLREILEQLNSPQEIYSISYVANT